MIAAGALTLAFSITAMAQEGTKYGKPFKTAKSFAATELVKKMGDKTSMDNVVITGEISQVCQAEGCWMKMKNDAGEDIFVKFKDHAFLIPKDLAGHKAIVNGKAIKKTVSVDELRHLAEDAGKTEQEIAAITEPRVELRVEATGVIID